MPPRLLPCPACQRHVQTSEPACPFCEKQLDFLDHAPVAGSWADTRLSRSARVALGAALALPGCAGSAGAPPPPGPTTTGTTDPGQPPSGEFATPPDAGGPPDEGAMRPKYGAPPPPEDEGTMRPKYGAPPPPDDPGAVKALYGVPAPE